MLRPLRTSPRGDAELRDRLKAAERDCDYTLVHQPWSAWLRGRELPAGSPTYAGGGSAFAIGSGVCFEPADLSVLVTNVGLTDGEVVPCGRGELRCWVDATGARAPYFEGQGPTPASIVLRSRTANAAPGQTFDVGSFTWFSDPADRCTPFGDDPPEVGVITVWQLLDLGRPERCRCSMSATRACQPWQPDAR